MNPDNTANRMRPKWRTDFRRAWGWQFGGKGKVIFFTVPFLVGFSVFAAFLNRENPINENFIFFSTIYAFWIGLFNASTIVTSAIDRGEWTYWVLGMKRTFFMWLAANSAVSLVLSLVQIAAFMAAVILASHVSHYCGNPDILSNCFIGSNMEPYFLRDVAKIPYHVVTLITLTWGLAMALAGITGVAYGVCVSCFAKDSLGATKLAVGLVVVAMVLSAPVLKKDSDDLPQFPPCWLKKNCDVPFFSSVAAFRENKLDRSLDILKFKAAQYAEGSPRREELKKEIGTLQKERDERPNKEANAGFFPHLLEDASYIFPQRYFYNIGRMMEKKVLSAGDQDDERFFEAYMNNTGSRPLFKHKLCFLKPEMRVIKGKPIHEWWELWRVINSKEKLEALKERTGLSDVCEGEFIRLLLKIICMEAAACITLSAAAFSAGYIKLKFTGECYAIR